MAYLSNKYVNKPKLVSISLEDYQITFSDGTITGLEHLKDEIERNEHLRYFLNDFEFKITLDKFFEAIINNNPEIRFDLLEYCKEILLEEKKEHIVTEYILRVLCCKYGAPTGNLGTCIENTINLHILAKFDYRNKIKEVQSKRFKVKIDSESNLEESILPSEKDNNFEYHSDLVYNLGSISDSISNSILNSLSDSDSDSESESESDSYFEYNLEYDSDFESDPNIDIVEIMQNLPIILVDKNRFSKNNDCIICLLKFKLEESAKLLPCEHYYHEECIKNWLKKKNTCPYCRKEVY